jgi:hypothetical protein
VDGGGGRHSDRNGHRGQRDRREVKALLTGTQLLGKRPCGILPAGSRLPLRAAVPPVPHSDRCRRGGCPGGSSPPRRGRRRPRSVRVQASIPTSSPWTVICEGLRHGSIPPRRCECCIGRHLGPLMAVRAPVRLSKSLQSPGLARTIGGAPLLADQRPPCGPPRRGGVVSRMPGAVQLNRVVLWGAQILGRHRAVFEYPAPCGTR